METAVGSENPNSQSEKEDSEKLNESRNDALLEEPSVNISADLPLAEALPSVLPKRQLKRARSSSAKVINNLDLDLSENTDSVPVQALEILVNPVESQHNVQRSHSPNPDDSDLCCLKGALSVESITSEKNYCVQSLGRDAHHDSSLGTDTLLEDPSMSIISDLVPAELLPHGDLSNRKIKNNDTISVAPASENSCLESCAEICTTISEKEGHQEDLLHEQKKKREKQNKRHKFHESNDNSCDISVDTSLAETIIPTVDQSVEPSVAGFSEQVLQVAMSQPPMEGISTNENSKIAEPIEDLSCSRKKKKRCKSKTHQGSDESCGNDKSCVLSLGTSLVESVMPGVDPSQQPPVSESSEQKLELTRPLMEGISTKISFESFEPIEDLSFSRKKKKKPRWKKSKTQESNDESCGNDKRGELSVGISLVESIMPGVDLPHQPPVSESSEQKLEFPQPLMEGISTRINSESSEPIEDLSSSRKKKKKTEKKSKTGESNDESCGNGKSCELSVGISLVESVMPGVDPSQHPPVSESSELKLELTQPLMEGISTKINSECSEPVEDLSSSRKKKKNPRWKKSNDESCGNDKSGELSVGISLVENIMPGIDPSDSEFSDEKLDLPQALVEENSTTVSSEGPKSPTVDFSCSPEQKNENRKRRHKTNECIDERCDLSVGTSLGGNTMPGVDLTVQPPVAVFSEQDLEVEQPLVEGIRQGTNYESTKPFEVLSCSQKRKCQKKRLEMGESNDTSCDPSVGTLVEKIIPGADPSPQPPLPIVSDPELDPSVGTLVEKIIPGADPSPEPPLPIVSDPELDVSQLLLEESTLQEKIEDKDQNKRCNASGYNDTNHQVCTGFPGQVINDVTDIKEYSRILKEQNGLQKSADAGSRNKTDMEVSGTKSYCSDAFPESENITDTERTETKIEVPSLPSSSVKADVDLAVAKDCSRSQTSNCAVEGPLVSVSKKKLLILDVNGLLADIVQLVPEQHKLYRPDTTISRKSVFKRPCCDSFLQFCFDNFNVGVWSSRTKNNVDMVVDYLWGDSRKKLLFCWNQSHCTTTKFNTLDNEEKPLVLKELRKLWEKHDPDLPWARGEYNETNTLLLDDSPYKALCNPENTAVFPYPFRFKDRRDRSLGFGGDIRYYLERLVDAQNVQEYVKKHPFGQRPITTKSRSWKFYRQVIEDQAESPKN